MEIIVLGSLVIFSLFTLILCSIFVNHFNQVCIDIINAHKREIDLDIRTFKSNVEAVVENLEEKIKP